MLASRLDGRASFRADESPVVPVVGLDQTTPLGHDGAILKERRMDLDRYGDHPSGAGEPRQRSSADDRDRIAEERDEVSRARDEMAASRDQNAGVRDLRAERRNQADSTPDAAALADRGGAEQDRRAGAEDRRHAADDRTAASRDRASSAHDRTVSSIDGLTGAHRRDAGMVELAREAARARRTHRPLVLAFVDVDGLKKTNDSLSHAAGDRLLVRVVSTMRARLRPYDLLIRVGGDEFLCSLLDLTTAQAAERFALINADLSQSPRASITAGIAALEPEESLDDLIGRADAALRSQRQQPPVPE
jgi:diguanylate cyclase (GGDEF)-like protein